MKRNFLFFILIILTLITFIVFNYEENSKKMYFGKYDSTRKGILFFKEVDDKKEILKLEKFLKNMEWKKNIELPKRKADKYIRIKKDAMIFMFVKIWYERGKVYIEASENSKSVISLEEFYKNLNSELLNLYRE